jgi:hypothetical protein
MNAHNTHPASVAGTRLVRTFRQTLRASHEQVFPLLCPVREKEWLPGWEARMIHSASGLAEPGAVFSTRHGGAEIVWFIAEHRPSYRVRFVRWHPGEMVVDCELDLSSPVPNTTWLDVRYTYTAVASAGRTRIEGMTPQQWLAQMNHWESHLNDYLATRR